MTTAQLPWVFFFSFVRTVFAAALIGHMEIIVNTKRTKYGKDLGIDERKRNERKHKKNDYKILL